MDDMGMQALVETLRASLSDAASVLACAGDQPYERFLAHAAQDFHRVRPRRQVGVLDLQAGQSDYPVPADLVAPLAGLWGVDEAQTRRPWDEHWPGQLPRLTLLRLAEDRVLWLSPAPTAAQITVLGSDYRYIYRAAHRIAPSGEQTTIHPGDRGLLLLRAQAEALKDLAMRNMAKPVQLRDGLAGMPRNGHPAALYEQLMKRFEGSSA